MGISPFFPCACREKQHFKVEFLFQFSFLHYSRIAFVELSFFLLSSYSCLFLQCLVKQLLQSCFICLSLMTFGEFWVIGIGRTVPRFWKHESLSAYQSYNCKEGLWPSEPFVAYGLQGQSSLLTCSRWLLKTRENVSSAPFHLSDWGCALRSPTVAHTSF